MVAAVSLVEWGEFVPTWILPCCADMKELTETVDKLSGECGEVCCRRVLKTTPVIQQQ